MKRKFQPFVMLRRLLLVAWIGSHSETDLAKSMGLPYTEGTTGLCEALFEEVQLISIFVILAKAGIHQV